MKKLVVRDKAYKLNIFDTVRLPFHLLTLFLTYTSYTPPSGDLIIEHLAKTN